MVHEYWAVFCFIIVLSIAEPVWSPLYRKYTLEFTQKGQEGIFFGLGKFSKRVCALWRLR